MKAGRVLAVQETRALALLNQAFDYSESSLPPLQLPDIPDQNDPNMPFPGLPDGDPRSSPGQEADDTLAILLPLLILLTTLLFLLLIFLIFLIVVRRNSKRGISLREEGGPTDLEREDEFDADGSLDGVEARWLSQTEETTKIGYMRAKVWQLQYPPNSQPTDITLSQFLSIQEKGVSAWSFEPDYESNPAIIVESRTEVTFLSDGVGMAPEEGGGCCVQSNLPIPKLNEVYYFECKMYEKPHDTLVAVGLTTKPFPGFRLPGQSKYSVGYFSSDGFKSHSYPFTGQSYGPPLTEGDVLGVGYRPRSGTVFFTRNGKKLEDAFIGFNKHNLFPTVGANGACNVHVNLGQAGFVFIEANVKKWGLAPMVGTLAPPPAYGSERGSILLESAVPGASTVANSSSRTPETPRRSHRTRRRVAVVESVPPARTPTNAAGAASALGTPTSSQPIRPSPLRHSRQASNISGRSSASHNSRATATDAADSDSDRENIQNPPTPGLFDVSLHSLHRFPDRERSDGEEDDGSEGSRSQGASGSQSGSESDGENRSLVPQQRSGLALNVHPPAYFPVDPNRYPAGVAEAMLSDVFSTPSARAQVNFAGLTDFSGASSFSERQRAYEANQGGTDGTSGSSGGAGSWWSWLARRSGANVDRVGLPTSTGSTASSRSTTSASAR